MWLANMNWIRVLGKKLAGVKGWVIVKKSIFEGATHKEVEVREGCVKFFLRELNPGYVVGKYELARYVG